jgi:peptide/nickel transport system substrate-binding protein
MIRRVALALVPGLVVLLLAAPVGGVETPRRGGILRIADREPPNLDPHLNLSFLTHSWASMVYSQLVRYAHGPEQNSPADFSIVPDLAEKWVQKSPTVITFTLRKGAHFHDKPPVNGREVTAHDVKYSIQRFMARSPLRTRLDVVKWIDVLDRYTLEVGLKHPFAPFLNHLAAAMQVPILPREVEREFEDFNRPEAMIGSGPFILKSYQKGVRIAFERNPNYYANALPYLDGVVIEITPDAAARLSLLRAGQVDLGHIWGFLSAKEVTSIKQTNLDIVSTSTVTMISAIIYFRTDHPPFNDLRVRRAISLAIDRKSWNDSMFAGEGCIDAGPVPCMMKDWKLPAAQMDPAQTKYLVGYDPVEAKRLLADAGYPNGFAVSMHYWPGYIEPFRTYYDRVADSLATIGVTVDLKPETYGTYISSTYLGKYKGIAIGPQFPGNEVDDWLYGHFFPDQFHNTSHVRVPWRRWELTSPGDRDAELNEMLTAQRRERDPQRRLAIVYDIQRYLADKAYYVYLPSWPQPIAYAPRVKGLKYHDGFSLGQRLMFTWLER